MNAQDPASPEDSPPPAAQAAADLLVRQFAQQGVFARRPGYTGHEGRPFQPLPSLLYGGDGAVHPARQLRVRHRAQQPILCPRPWPAPPECGDAQPEAVVCHGAWVTVYEPGDLVVHSQAQVPLFGAFPGSRGPLHPSELLAATVLDRQHRAPQPPGQLAARGALPGPLHSVGQQPVFFLRPEIRVTGLLNPLPGRAGRWGSRLPPTGARRDRLLFSAAGSRLPGSVVLHGDVERSVSLRTMRLSQTKPTLSVNGAGSWICIGGDWSRAWTGYAAGQKGQTLAGT